MSVCVFECECVCDCVCESDLTMEDSHWPCQPLSNIFSLFHLKGSQNNPKDDQTDKLKNDLKKIFVSKEVKRKGTNFEKA